jgi:2-desacetyl-2-hydroxyethyl bacteriochlorophyllide A dehydrogenase
LQSTDQARAVFFVAERTVEVRDVALEPRPADECEVHTTVMAISAGTELLVYRGQQATGLAADDTIASLGGSLRYPLRYGYSAVGTVHAGPQVGARVFAFQPHQDRFLATASDCLLLPDSLHDEDAALLPLVETAITIVHDAAVRFGEAVLVIGQGVVGLLCAQLLLECGAHPVITIEPRAERRERSAALGCLALPGAQTAGGDAEHLRSLTSGRGVDVAIDVSGSPAAVQTGIDSLAFSGSLVVASWLGDRPTQLDLGGSFHRKRLRLRSSQVSTIEPGLRGRWDKQRLLALAMTVAERLQPRRYVTHTFALESAAQAFTLLDSGAEGVLQVLLRSGD